MLQALVNVRALLHPVVDLLPLGLSLRPLHAKEEAVNRCLDVVCFTKVLEKRAFRCVVLGLVKGFSLYWTLTMDTRVANWLVWWLGRVLRLEHR